MSFILIFNVKSFPFKPLKSYFFLMQVSLSAINDFEFVKQIGIGQYSFVYEVRHKPTSETYAMKVISKSDVGDAAYLNFVKNEKKVCFVFWLADIFLLTLTSLFDRMPLIMLGKMSE